MNVEEIRKKVRSLCEDAGLQFFFAVPNASEWAVTDCEHLRKIVSYHKELETLPPVTPTRKKGKWIKSNIGGAKVCSICQAHMGLSNFKYCPNCGTEMKRKVRTNEENEDNNL